MLSTRRMVYLIIVVIYGCVPSGKSEKMPFAKNTLNTEHQANPDPAHNSQNALDWQGTYQGMVPCADCEGIDITLSLNGDSTFEMRSAYMGKSDEVFAEHGKFSWTDDGMKVILALQNGVQQYRVAENKLIHLDAEGNIIAGVRARGYELAKSSPTLPFENIKWMLVSIANKALEEGDSDQAPFIVFDSEEKRISGNGGCNTFFGSYKLKDGNGISLSEIGSTMMACESMAIEAAFQAALGKVEAYAFSGTNLVLFNANGEELAKFEKA